MRHFARLVLIVFTVLRYGMDELALSGFRQRWVRGLVRVTTFGRRLDAPRGQRLRMALEHLGPIFVKFGQVLSTRRDLLPEDVADELARLQDRVPPFPAAQARRLVEQAFGRPIEALFSQFDAEPVASASIAQVDSANCCRRATAPVRRRTAPRRRDDQHAHSRAPRPGAAIWYARQSRCWCTSRRRRPRSATPSDWPTSTGRACRC